MSKSSFLTISDRGQLTIPKVVRDQISAQHFSCHIDGDKIVLKPLQTRDEFFEELKLAEKEYHRKGGFTMEEMKKMYNIK